MTLRCVPRLGAPLLVGLCLVAGPAAAQGINSTAIGVYSSAGGANAIAVGVLANAFGDNASALGNLSTAADNAVALGVLSRAGVNGTALGNLSAATGTNSTAAGILSAAGGNDSAAFGNQASASGRISAAFGALAAATGANSTALGGGAVAQGANSVAIGAGSVAEGDNVVSLGAPGNERRLTHVANGVDPGDVVTVGQYQAGLADTLAQTQVQVRSSAAQTQAVSAQAQMAMTQQVYEGMAALTGRIDGVQQEARAGIAASAALAPVIMPSAPGRTTLSLNTSYYRGEVGLGLGVAHRLDLSLPVIVHGSYASGGSEHIGRAGVAIEF